MNEQLTLAVDLPDDETFDSYSPGDNQQLCQHLMQLCKPLSISAVVNPAQITFISGASGSGKSHLLYGLCHAAQLQGQQAMYLDLQKCRELDPQVLDSLEFFDLTTLDNVDAICNVLNWEEALFNLINRIKQQGTSQLVVTANAGAKKLPWQLADLASRLIWGVSYQVNPLSDEEQIQTLIDRAYRRGLNLPPDVARFLCLRVSRNMKALMQTLDALAKLNLQAKRRLTIPFVKQALKLG